MVINLFVIFSNCCKRGKLYEIMSPIRGYNISGVGGGKIPGRAMLYIIVYLQSLCRKHILYKHDY